MPGKMVKGAYRRLRTFIVKLVISSAETGMHIYIIFDHIELSAATRLFFYEVFYEVIKLTSIK